MNWKIFPKTPEILPGFVHVVCVDSACKAEFYEPSWHVLNQEEKESCLRFRFEKDKIQHILSRGCLRILLGKYLDVPAQLINFTTTSHGKLAIAEETNLFTFNVTHSDDLILFAFALTEQLGIDVEHVLVNRDFVGMAKRFFADDEYSALIQLPNDQQTQAFYHIWTRKEAFIKAIGEGLSHPLDSFSVNLTENQAALIRSEHLGEKIQQWSLASFSPKENYIAALAIDKPFITTEFFTLENLC